MQQARILIVCLYFWLISLSSARISKHKMSSNKRDKYNRHAGGLEWSYGKNNGPDKWAKKFKLCGGTHQSPVDINKQSTRKKHLKPITFEGYEKPYNSFIENNGHAVVVTFPEESTYSIKGGGLDATYNLTGVHFHWGKTDRKGSEHKVNGKQFPMEMHLVHVNLEQQAHGKTGIAVLGVLLQLSDEDNPALEPIVDLLKFLKHDKKLKLEESIRLCDFLPEQPKHYYRYLGSLTTPPCTEDVIWTVFAKPAAISHSQIKAFRSIRKSPGKKSRHLSDNFRPLQKLNGRKILESKPSYY